MSKKSLKTLFEQDIKKKNNVFEQKFKIIKRISKLYKNKEIKKLYKAGFTIY